MTLRRIGAYLLDIAALFIVLAPLTFGVASLFYPRGPGPSQLSIAILLGFSIPAWAYFTFSDASQSGATLGKRILGIAVRTREGTAALPFLRALARTAIKLLPWELAHLFAFTFAERLPEASRALGLIASNVLAASYLALLGANAGRRTLHDFVAATEVRSARG